MSVHIWAEIVCDECSGTGPGVHVGRSRRTRGTLVDLLDQEARREGWEVPEDGPCLCPCCKTEDPEELATRTSGSSPSFYSVTRSRGASGADTNPGT